MSTRNLCKGLIAGVIAGLVATAAKSAAEKFYAPHIHGEPEPPSILADKLSGYDLDEQQRLIAAETIHWGFGVAAGAFYGALAEFYPAATSRDGATFGLALMALTHNTALPALGLAPEPEDQSPREQTSEATTHVIYGVVAEKVRGFVRNIID